MGGLDLIKDYGSGSSADVSLSQSGAHGTILENLQV